MPYNIKNNYEGCAFAVINTQTAKIVPGGCHPTHEKALAHMRALYANVPDAKLHGNVKEDANITVESGEERPHGMHPADLPQTTGRCTYCGHLKTSHGTDPMHSNTCSECGPDMPHYYQGENIETGA